MKEYKTIAGPIGLEAKIGEDYETAVKKYAAIIDAEAVGGWELLLIQQIPVKKWVYLTLIIGAIVGALVGAIVGSALLRDGGTGGFFVGLIAGAGLGCVGLKKETEVFNMLVFVKDK